MKKTSWYLSFSRAQVVETQRVAWWVITLHDTCDGFEVWPRAWLSILDFKKSSFSGWVIRDLPWTVVDKWYDLENHYFGFLLALVRWYIMIQKETSAWFFSLLVLFALTFELFALHRKSDNLVLSLRTCKYTFYHTWMVWNNAQPLQAALTWII